MKYMSIKPVLDRLKVQEDLQTLHSKFVLVPIDKASNNVAFVCKRYYAEVILQEIGILGTGNRTYLRSELSKDEIIETNVQYAKKLKIDVTDKEKELPLMYWTPKKHKKPTG